MNRTVTLILFVLFTAFTDVRLSTPVAASGCGLKPLTPLGCKSDAVCVCDAKGNCSWVFTNCR